MLTVSPLSVQATEVSSLLSTYQPQSGAYLCPSTETQYWQSSCAPLAFVQPGGIFGSLTVSCAVAGTANTRDVCGQTSSDNGWNWYGYSSNYGGSSFGRKLMSLYSSSNFASFQSGCGGSSSSRSGWSASPPSSAPMCPTVCPKTCYGV